MSTANPNAEQIEYWNQTAGPKWVALQAMIDDQIRPLGALAMDRAALKAGERVLDVGCGCGDTTRELAQRVGSSGSVLGIDISAVMLERARQVAHDARVANVHFACADAQTHAFSADHFDVIFSRFGVMFFAHPEEAFANLRHGLRSGGRIAFVCWQALPENPWMSVPMMAALPLLPPMPLPDPNAPGPFAFADRDRVRGILERAGFAAVEFEDVRRTLRIGAGGDVDRTVDFMLQMGPASRLLRDADPSLIPAVAAAMREVLKPYHGPDGVQMPSSTWIVTARNP